MIPQTESPWTLSIADGIKWMVRPKPNRTTETRRKANQTQTQPQRTQRKSGGEAQSKNQQQIFADGHRSKPLGPAKPLGQLLWRALNTITLCLGILANRHYF